jgi:Ni/Fe-hydrogenase 1 B-type cytochrome subunit
VIDIQYLRLIHFCVMFTFFAFVIHHVYSAVLVSWEERNGLIESIFTGYKFIPRHELDEDARQVR